MALSPAGLVMTRIIQRVIQVWLYVLYQELQGQQDNYYRLYYGYNHTITATAKKQWVIFPSWMVGNIWQDYEFQQWAVVGNNL